MSQVPQDNDSPWAWTDKTINSLMKELQTVRDLVRKYPNNMELGKKIREWSMKDE